MAWLGREPNRTDKGKWVEWLQELEQRSQVVTEEEGWRKQCKRQPIATLRTEALKIGSSHISKQDKNQHEKAFGENTEWSRKERKLAEATQRWHDARQHSEDARRKAHSGLHLHDVGRQERLKETNDEEFEKTVADEQKRYADVLLAQRQLRGALGRSEPDRGLAGSTRRTASIIAILPRSAGIEGFGFFISSTCLRSTDSYAFRNSIIDRASSGGG